MTPPSAGSAAEVRAPSPAALVGVLAQPAAVPRAVVQPPVARLFAALRSSATRVLGTVERRAHPLRRSRALRHVAATQSVGSVLIVCHGNICRSPFAAAALMRATRWRGIELTVTSAGFIGPGRHAPAAALKIAARRDIDLSAHRSTLLSASAVRQADVILVMARYQVGALRAKFGREDGVLVLGDFDPQPIEARTIVDPWARDEETFEESYQRIERCVGEFAEALAQGLAVVA